jgi:hypothetical protein
MLVDPLEFQLELIRHEPSRAQYPEAALRG